MHNFQAQGIKAILNLKSDLKVLMQTQYTKIGWVGKHQVRCLQGLGHAKVKNAI